VSEDGTQESAPLLRVVRGNPSAEQRAALVAVVASRASAAEPAPPTRPLWGRPVLRPVLTPGPGAWRASGLPR
jgi:hypothetical protein